MWWRVLFFVHHPNMLERVSFLILYTTCVQFLIHILYILRETFVNERTIKNIVNFKNFTTSPLNSFYSPSYTWGREWKYLLKVYMMPKANLVVYCIATGTRESSIYSCFPFLLREDPLSIACGLPWCWFHRNNVVDSIVNSRLEELIVWCSWNFLKVF